MKLEQSEQGIWRGCIARMRSACRGRACKSAWPAWEREQCLPNVCNAIRLGFFDEAQAMLDAVGASAARDAAWLNLVGVLHEQRSAWNIARRYYGRAIRADGSYEPAQQNMRRLYELATFGHCAKRVALGDEVPALIALLRTTDDAATAPAESAAELDRRYNQGNGQGQTSIAQPRLGLERLR